MIDLIKWTERKFKFDFPVSEFPVIVCRLKGTLPRIKSIVVPEEYLRENFSDEKLSEKVNGAYSLKEHIGHLCDLEELHEGRLEDFKNKKEILRAADMSNAKTTAANHNQKPLWVLLEEFQLVRNSFINKIENLSAEELAQTSFHPRLKIPMRLVDMTFFVAEHDDHHLAIMMRDWKLY